MGVRTEQRNWVHGGWVEVPSTSQSLLAIINPPDALPESSEAALIFRTTASFINAEMAAFLFCKEALLKKKNKHVMG